MTKVIRHTDDLGMTKKTTAYIIQSWINGHLDSFSIIANGDAAEDVRIELERNSARSVRIAVHFNLTEGRSSAPRNEVPLLVDDKGEFRHSFGSLFAVAMVSALAKKTDLFNQILHECKAQIAEVSSICGDRQIITVDGHNHIHMIPGVFSAVAQAARDAGIPEIRISDEPFYVASPWHDWRKMFFWINIAKHLLLKLLSANSRRVVKQFGLHSPDAIVGVLYSGKMSALRAMCGVKAAAHGSIVEVVFHIGRANLSETARWRNNSYARFHISELRDSERAELVLFSQELGVRLYD